VIIRGAGGSASTTMPTLCVAACGFLIAERGAIPPQHQVSPAALWICHSPRLLTQRHRRSAQQVEFPITDGVSGGEMRFRHRISLSATSLPSPAGHPDKAIGPRICTRWYDDESKRCSDFKSARSAHHANRAEPVGLGGRFVLTEAKPCWQKRLHGFSTGGVVCSYVFMVWFVDFWSCAGLKTKKCKGSD
jgi:hypothetical protein